MADLGSPRKEDLLICCVALAYGGTLTTDEYDPELGMRRVDPRAAATLHTLRRHGFTLVLASNTNDRGRAPALTRAGVRDLFRNLVQSHELVQSLGLPIEKPHELFYGMVCHAAASEPPSVLFVGNNITRDVRGPLKYGMKAALVRPDGLQDGEELPVGALLIRHVADLPALLGLPGDS